MKLIGSIWGKGKDLVIKIKQYLAGPVPLKAKVLILSSMFLVVAGGGYTSYMLYDYTQNNPKFCVGCHIMEPAFSTWDKSEHKDVNCHDCHHLSVPEMNQLLISFVVHRPTMVPGRQHGRVIVGDKYCNQCHSEGKGKKVNRSLFHARHVYMEQLQCTQCHGKLRENKEGLHQFVTPPQSCLACHPDKHIRSVGMKDLACLNCHTERTDDLRPGRKKCLFCHSADENIRRELIDGGTIDAKYYQPDAAMVKKSRKIAYAEKAPMQFNCYECHKAHTPGNMTPSKEDCMRCHAGIRKIGKHKVHLDMDMQCNSCHRPHLWKVTEPVAKSECVKCHEYKSPGTFIQ